MVFIYLSVLSEWNEKLQEANRRSDVKAIVLTGKQKQKKIETLSFFVLDFEGLYGSMSFGSCVVSLLCSFFKLKIVTFNPFVCLVSWNILIISGKGGVFSGGFDLNIFQKVHKTGTKVSSLSFF